MLDRQAAIKLIHPEYLKSMAGEQANTLLRLFEREVKATSSLRSPHTIQVYDYGTTDDGTFYYVMELLEGRDLNSLVEQYGPFPVGRVIYVLRQVCDSLAEAHRIGLIHRDIKPANIYLAEVSLQYDFVKVLDFGLVRHTPGSDWKGSRLTVEGIVAGSPAFMAPELIRDSSTIGEKVDIYSLGCVAYWLLTGQLVVENVRDSNSLRCTMYDNKATLIPRVMPLQTMAAHLRQSSAPPVIRYELEIPAALDQIVIACLQKDPARRPQSMEALSRQLAECPVTEPWTEMHAEEWWRVHHPLKAPVEWASGESKTLERYISRRALAIQEKVLVLEHPENSQVLENDAEPLHKMEREETTMMEARAKAICAQNAQHNMPLPLKADKPRKRIRGTILILSGVLYAAWGAVPMTIGTIIGFQQGGFAYGFGILLVQLFFLWLGWKTFIEGYKVFAG